jgi:hypothetical protein
MVGIEKKCHSQMEQSIGKVRLTNQDDFLAFNVQ